jgi:phosphoribosyl 1,2-cyclic phosphodiesterase
LVLRVCLLASGSRGNAVYVEAGDARLLLDAGLSARELVRRLALLDVAGEDLQGLLVSHDHHDHSSGIGPLSRRFGLPVFMHPLTREALPKLGELAEHRAFEAGETLSFRGLEIETIPLTHDAAVTVGYVFHSREGKIGVVTDLGIATRLVADRLKGCRVLILEANHDEDLLRDGPYPWHLKQRIRGNHGHLSNSACAELLSGLLWDGLEAVFLAHLSEVNNTPEHALACVRSVLDAQTTCEPELHFGTQDRISACFRG